MKCWFYISSLQKKIGFITDIFGNYVEVFEPERQKYYIVHYTKIELK